MVRLQFPECSACWRSGFPSFRCEYNPGLTHHQVQNVSGAAQCREGSRSDTDPLSITQGRTSLERNIAESLDQIYVSNWLIPDSAPDHRRKLKAIP
ncbi:hypothetical protein chiPu_0000100 [Chiloscyllium punctatum]|uniref:Uncharacterized protein n=1 Tax=Chiloscyllium punctatum TaxID=137246 RepID=A0A401RNB0_CHIPU|nr:hypothetical protein [Chiloscyllium punctatum]